MLLTLILCIFKHDGADSSSFHETQFSSTTDAEEATPQPLCWISPVDCAATAVSFEGQVTLSATYQQKKP